jgi:hypothetical protein
VAEFRAFFRSPKLHLILMGVWCILAVPTVLWWSNSIPWLVFMSIYAIIAGHWSGYQGARAEKSNDKDQGE